MRASNCHIYPSSSETLGKGQIACGVHYSTSMSNFGLNLGRTNEDLESRGSMHARESNR